MVIFLVIVVFILLCIIFIQYMNQKNRNKDIKYMAEKLSSIMENSTTEKLKVVTDHKELRLLLIEINKLLDNNQDALAGYTKAEMSMRKMLSNISHDLKTPLTVVLGYIETLRIDENISSEERSILLSKVQDKAKEVLELINKFFDLAKLESGDKDIPLTRVNMNELCRKNILAFYDILDSKGFKVSIHLPDTDIFALGNEEALDRVMNNLISNAIKYGSDGNIVGLLLRCDEQFVYVDVWDKGKGIDEQNKDRVFERMYTLEDSRNKFYQGSGLGLTITKRLIEKQKGEISLKSKPYEETVFTVKLKRINY